MKTFGKGWKLWDRISDVLEKYISQGGILHVSKQEGRLKCT